MFLNIISVSLSVIGEFFAVSTTPWPKIIIKMAFKKYKVGVLGDAV